MDSHRGGRQAPTATNYIFDEKRSALRDEETIILLQAAIVLARRARTSRADIRRRGLRETIDWLRWEAAAT